MMQRASFGAVVVAALLVLAGCTGGVGGPGADTATPDADESTTTPDGGVTAGDTGTVHFYVSDEPNAIEDFEHLNVSISAVGLHRIDGGETPDDDTETPTPGNDTATPTPGNDTATPAPGNDTSTATDDGEADDGEGSDDGEEAGEKDEDSESDGENARWVEYEVDRTVDLTELVGANATKLDVLEAPAGTYDKVFVYVEEIDAVLENGEEVNVKLPSEKLHINKQFVVGNGQTVEFVFDIAVHKAGKSGKYILKPVVSQSGTGDEVDIEETDEKDGDDAADRQDDAGSLDAEFVGPVEPGGEATVKVTGEDGPVAGATVEIDGEVVGETGEDGTLTFSVPSDAEKIRVTVRNGDAEAELEREFDSAQGEGQDALARPPV